MGAKSKRGQVLVMVTLVLIVMCGMLGLAVDLGWSYYIRKAASAATDAAALAAVIDAHNFVGSGTYTCGGAHVICQNPPQTCPGGIPSPPGGTNNLDNGCLYAQKNTYGIAGAGDWDNIMMSAGVPPATPACDGIGIWPDAPPGQQICVHYWVTARAYEGIPQLFSSVLGNTFGGSSARSTAAIVDAVVPGSLYALNRENDPGYRPPAGRGGGASFEAGVGLEIQGNTTVTAGGGVFVSSQANGAVKKAPYAIEGNGNATLTGSSINIYGSGAADPKANYDPEPQNNSNYSLFEDPMAGKGQPPAPTSAEAPDREVPLGQIGLGSNCSNPITMAPGTYFATDMTGAPTGAPITVTGCVTFSAGSNTTWGDYVFFGGLRFTNQTTRVTFGPGRYIVAGAKGNEPVFRMVTGVTLTDMTPLDGEGNSLPPINQGEIFVFTNPDYPGLHIPGKLQSRPDILNQLDFGWVDIQTGNDSNSSINLHGLNRDMDLPEGLRTFAPTLFWWDQNNSKVEYDSEGNPVYNGDNPADPVLNRDPDIDPFMRLLAGTNTDLYGLIYMPRGTYLDFQGNPGMESPLRVIAGSISLGGTSELLMSPTAPFAYVTKVALIE